MAELKFINEEVKFKNIEYKLDKTKMTIGVEIHADFKTSFNEIQTIYQKDTKTNIEIIDDKIYYFYNVFFGCEANLNSKFMHLCISYDELIIGNNKIDFDDLQVNKISIEIDHKENNKLLSDIEEALGKKIEFTLKEIKYSVELSFIPRRYLINVESIKKVKFNNFVNESDKFYNFITFAIGQYYDINTIKFYIDENEFLYTRRINDKYYSKKIDIYYNKILINLKDSGLRNKYQKWKSIMKKSEKIHDVYLVTINQNYFRDLSLALMINLIDGYYKTFYKTNLSLFQSKITKANEKYNLYNRYYYIYLNEPYLNINSRKRKSITNKIFNHRNYFSHFFEKGKDLSRKDMIEILNLLNKAYRVKMLEDIGFKINKIALEEYIVDNKN